MQTPSSIVVVLGKSYSWASSGISRPELCLHWKLVDKNSILVVLSKGTARSRRNPIVYKESFSQKKNYLMPIYSAEPVSVLFKNNEQ